MERKLASIRQIKNILPIPDADNIELAIVDGWQVVIGKKDNLKIGDIIVYFEIDSLLPIRNEFEFLRKGYFKKMADGVEGFRLKTIKLRGHYSQGLVMPISILDNTNLEWKVGEDVSELIGVVKYEPPIPPCLQGISKGKLPGFIQKTDEERIQNLSDIYDTLKQNVYYVTEKLEGSSTTFYFNNGEFGVGTRNLELLETSDHTLWKFANEFRLKDKLESMGKNIALQGELIGEGIQGNPYKIKGQTIRFFRVFNIDSYSHYPFPEFCEIISKLGLETVPVLNTEFTLPQTIDELLLYADGESVLNMGTKREGIVVKQINGTKSFKVVSNKYLLNEK
jgi:RNA ligase (TIGR02306 family)